MKCSVHRNVFPVGKLCSHMGSIYGWRLDATVTQILPFCNAWRCDLGYRYCPIKAKLYVVNEVHSLVSLDQVYVID